MRPIATLTLGSLLLAGFADTALAEETDGQRIDYQVNDEAFTGYLASAPDEARGTVLIVHDWDGLTDYERQRADMLAAEGYDAFAIDLYGKGNRPVETDAKKAETARLYDDRERMRRLTLAGLEEARRQGVAQPTVVMGYCFGGAVVLELARSGQAEDVRGYATFHGGLDTPEGQAYSADTPPILIAHGGADTSISMSDVAASPRSWKPPAPPTRSRFTPARPMPSPSSAATPISSAPTKNPGPPSTTCSARCCKFPSRGR
ncbi:dienelactone hydrolase family protein [Halomonas elongata]|uniref:Dienelactone hydrolase family protein n=1 Tax=Halomonas elongata TaxID=2746 RepID=A0A1B8NYW0_HALEL|nr:dienelactone hydrolase family protein [Halomonas elongata]